MPEAASPAQSVLEALGFVLFAREESGALRLLGETPAWLGVLWPALAENDGVLPIADASPFFENFLIDAEECWNAGGSGQAKSGPWVEDGSGAEGIAWCFGQNELQFDFYDAPNRFAHRAIRKRGLADRSELWANTAAGLFHLNRRLDIGAVEINDTCRPYHLGWILEAWAGREKHIELLGHPS